MAEFQPILISTEGTSIPYKEGQFIFAEKSFNDGEGTTYAAGVYVDAENVRKWVTRQGAPGKDGTDGTDGTNGIGISSVDSINHSIVGDETVTACRVEYDGDKQPTDFYVYAENGKNGAINMILGEYTGQYTYIWCIDTPVRTGVPYIALITGTNGPNKVGDIVECTFNGNDKQQVSINRTLGNIRGATGQNGANGRSVTGVNSVSHEIVGDETITHCDVMYDEGNSTRFDVRAQNGADGKNGNEYTLKGTIEALDIQLVDRNGKTLETARQHNLTTGEDFWTLTPFATYPTEGPLETQITQDNAFYKIHNGIGGYFLSTDMKWVQGDLVDGYPGSYHYIIATFHNVVSENIGRRYGHAIYMDFGSGDYVAKTTIYIEDDNPEKYTLNTIRTVINKVWPFYAEDTDKRIWLQGDVENYMDNETIILNYISYVSAQDTFTFYIHKEANQNANITMALTNVYDNVTLV